MKLLSNMTAPDQIIQYSSSATKFTSNISYIPVTHVLHVLKRYGTFNPCVGKHRRVNMIFIYVSVTT